MALPKISIVFLQGVILLHFVLTVWANQCHWLPISYQLCNFLVLAVGVGAVAASSNNEMAEMFLVGMAFALLQDIIVIATFFRKIDTTPFFCEKRDHFKFSLAMSILNLLVKPVSLIIIFLNYIGRGDGGLKDKVAQFRVNQGAATEPPNAVLPPQQAPPPY